uniref:Putative secreted protein n=1 Tax=Anopheles marajoara TaxID=58244 RepID=A0A2M4C8X0_9DIPT
MHLSLPFLVALWMWHKHNTLCVCVYRASSISAAAHEGHDMAACTTYLVCLSVLVANRFFLPSSESQMPKMCQLTTNSHQSSLSLSSCCTTTFSTFFLRHSESRR